MTIYFEITADMTIEEQLELHLKNNLITDELSEPNKDIDPEYYEWYIKNKKQSFEEIYSVTPAKTIFYKVETNKGDRYYVTNERDWTDVWKFKEVSEEHFESIN